MTRKLFNILLIIVMALSLATAALAQEDGPQNPDTPASLNQGGAKSYVVVMDLQPIISYEGDVDGYEATKPGKGGKINPNSAHVRKYDQFLEKKHNASLEAAGASSDQKIHDYTVALNGYSAILTEDQASAIEAQKNVVLVLEDQMRYADTDSSPDFLGLTGPAGAWQTGYDGEGVVVGIIA